MKNITHLLLFLLLAIFSTACQTVTISPKGKTIRYSSTPQYQETQNFFLFGLIGESTVNLRSVCPGRAIKQMQTQKTFLNGFLTVITLGIYTPRTASVWCKRKRATRKRPEVEI